MFSDEVFHVFRTVTSLTRCDMPLADAGLPDGDAWKLPECVPEETRPPCPVSMSISSPEQVRRASRAAGYQRHLAKPLLRVRDVKAAVAEHCAGML